MNQKKGLFFYNGAVGNVVICLLLDIMLLDIWLLLHISQLGTCLNRVFSRACKVLLLLFFGFVSMVTFTALIMYFKDANFSRTWNIMKIGSNELIFDNDLIKKELDRMMEKTHYLESIIHDMSTHITHVDEPVKEIQLPDFASEAAGGFIIDTPDTEPYESNGAIKLFGIHVWTLNNSPQQIIKPWSQAGECWPFKGHHGKIEIHLAYATQLDSFTLEHIPVTASHTGSINSAPKNFKVYGYLGDQYILLDSFAYNIKGSPSQTFHIKNEAFRGVPVKKILLEITSNWGNPEYTCIYRFKVHGRAYQLDDRSLKSRPE